jgi:hypothetical protein
MKVATSQTDGCEDEGELFRIGNSLVLENKGVSTRIILTQSQWKLLAESAKERADDSTR